MEHKLNNKGFLNILLVGIVIIALAGAGYWYWQDVKEDTNVNKNPTPTSTPKAVEIVNLGELKKPDNIDEWNDTSYNSNKPWSFKYPPDWEEVQSEADGTYGYLPPNHVAGTWGLGIIESEIKTNKIEELLPLSVGSVIDDYYIFRREIFEVTGKKGELIIYMPPGNEKIEKSANVYADNKHISITAVIQEVSIFKEGQCLPNKTLMINAGNYKEDGFSNLEFSYEKEVKEILSTFEISGCPE